MRCVAFDDGVALCADACAPETLAWIRPLVQGSPMVLTDPPYGNLLTEASWDRFKGSQAEFVAWMLGWTRDYAELLPEGGAMYVWGCYGTPRFRPFFEYLSRVEVETELRLANFLTWSKKRGYGVQNNYLQTREELAYLVKGDPKKPHRFEVPYLEAKRDYAGFNADYPARSENYRRTNVWTDVTEILRGKVHAAQKPLRVLEVPIEVHTVPGDTIIDPFAGSMSTAWAARGLGRRWICVERDEKIFEAAISALQDGERKR